MVLHAFFYLRTIPHTERFTHNQREFFLSTCARLRIQFHLMRIYRNDLVLLQQTSFILFCSLLFSSRFSLFLVCICIFLSSLFLLLLLLLFLFWLVLVLFWLVRFNPVFRYSTRDYRVILFGVSQNTVALEMFSMLFAFGIQMIVEFVCLVKFSLAISSSNKNELQPTRWRTKIVRIMWLSILIWMNRIQAVIAIATVVPARRYSMCTCVCA